jgi:hypothetical protein
MIGYGYTLNCGCTFTPEIISDQVFFCDSSHVP